MSNGPDSKQLLTDAEELTTRYGLLPVSTEMINRELVTLSKNRTATFVAAYSVFKARMGLVQEQSPIQNQVQWAIHDRAKFKELVEDLKGFIDGLKDITETPQSNRRHVEMEQEDVQSIRDDQSSLKLLMEACADDHHEIADAASLFLQLPYMNPDERTLNIHDWMETVTPIITQRPPQVWQSHRNDMAEGRIPSRTTFIVCKDHNFADEGNCLRRRDVEAIARGGYSSLFGSRSLGQCLVQGINDSAVEPPSAAIPQGQSTLYIYCSPSRPIIELALSVYGNTGPYRVVVRVDDRLCEETHSHEVALGSILSLDEAPEQDIFALHAMRAFEHAWMTGPFDLAWAKERSAILAHSHVHPDRTNNDDIELSEIGESGISTPINSFIDSGTHMEPQIETGDDLRLRKAIERLSHTESRLDWTRAETNWRTSWSDTARQSEQAVAELGSQHHFVSPLPRLLHDQMVPEWLESFPHSHAGSTFVATTLCNILKNLPTLYGVPETIRALGETFTLLETFVHFQRRLNTEHGHGTTEIYICAVEVLQVVLHGQVYGSLESTSVSTDYDRQLSSAVSLLSRATSRLERRAASNPALPIRSEPQQPHQAPVDIKPSPALAEGSDFGIQTYLDQHKLDSTCAGIAVLASSVRCAQLMAQKPFVNSAVLPRDRHIFRFDAELESDKMEHKQYTLLRPALYGRFKLNAPGLNISPGT